MMIGKLNEFNVKTGNWSLYVERFEIFCRTNKIDEELRLPSLISAIGDEAYELLSVLACPDNASDMSYSDVVKIMAEHLKPPSFVAERCRFRDRKQQVGETVLQYLSQLKTLSKHCDFKDTLQDNLRDQFVYGLKDKQLKRKLLDEQTLVYHDAVRISCETEISSKAKRPHAEPQLSTVVIVKEKSSSGDTVPENGKVRYKMQCGKCKQRGHLRRDCPMRSEVNKGHSNNSNVERALEDCGNAPRGQTENDSSSNGEKSVSNNGLNQFNTDSDKVELSPKNAQEKPPSKTTENDLTPNGAPIDNQPLKSAQDGQPPKKSQETPLKDAQVEDHKSTLDSQAPNDVNNKQSPKNTQHEEKTPKDLEDGLLKNTSNNQPPKNAVDQQPPKNAQDESLSPRSLLSDLRDKILYDEENLTIDEIVQGLQDKDLTIKSAAARAARLMLQQLEPNIEYFIKSGLVQLLVEALDITDCQNLFIESASAIGHIPSAATHEQMLAVIDMGIIPKLISLIPEGGEITEQVVITLGKILEDCAYLRDIVLDNEALPAMLPFMKANIHIDTLNATVWTFSLLCRNKDESLNFKSIAPGLPYISELLLDADVEVLNDACSALFYLSEGDKNFIEGVQTTPKLLSRLIMLLGHSRSYVKTAALRIVSNMLAGSDTQADRCLNAECLTHIVLLLSSHDSSIVKTASYAVSNILSGTEYQVQRALNAGILTHLHKVMAYQDFPCKIEAAYGISSLCINGNPDQLELLIKSDCLEPYCRLITSDDLDVVSTVLDGLTHLTRSAETNGLLDILSSKFDEISFKQKLTQKVNDLKQKCWFPTFPNDHNCKKIVRVIDTMSKLLATKALMLAGEPINDTFE